MRGMAVEMMVWSRAMRKTLRQRAMVMEASVTPWGYWSGGRSEMTEGCEAMRRRGFSVLVSSRSRGTGGLSLVGLSHFSSLPTFVVVVELEVLSLAGLLPFSSLSTFEESSMVSFDFSIPSLLYFLSSVFPSFLPNNDNDDEKRLCPGALRICM